MRWLTSVDCIPEIRALTRPTTALGSAGTSTCTRQAGDLGEEPQQLHVLQDVFTAHVEVVVRRRLDGQRPADEVEDIHDGDGLDLAVHPGRDRGEEGYALAQSPQQFVGRGSGPDDHRGAQHDRGHRAVEEDLLDLVPRTKVGGELAVQDQAGQVDDPLHTGPLAGRRHPLGSLAIPALEVLGLHGVHEVDDGVDPVDGAGDEVVVLDVELAGLDLVVPRELLRPRAARRDDGVAGCEELGHEAGADVSRRAGDQDPQGAVLVGGVRGWAGRSHGRSHVRDCSAREGRGV